MLKQKHERSRGILHVPAADPMRGHARYFPSPDLAPFIEHYWSYAHDFAAPQLTETLPFPVMYLIFEHGHALVAGVQRRKFSRMLEGAVRVRAVKFRPGGFRPFIDVSASTLTDKTVSLQTLFGARHTAFIAGVLTGPDDQTAFAAIENFLRALAPQADATLALISEIATKIANDRTITHVDQIVAQFGIGLRKLQRLCDDYVGIGPKWMIQRYRLHEAAARIAQEAATDWADIAIDLGYADQAHFIRDFRRVVGHAPAEYARRIRRGK